MRIGLIHCVIAAGLLMPLKDADVERALRIGRGFDQDRARFHKPYIVAINDATVEQIEIVTEFRRVVLFAEDRIRQGDHMFGPRQVDTALRQWRGRVTVIARVRLHPLNTYVMVPEFRIAVGEPPLKTVDARRTPVNAALGPNQMPGDRTAIVAAFIEADLDAAAIGQTLLPVRVILDGKDLTRTMVDFGRLE